MDQSLVKQYQLMRKAKDHITSSKTIDEALKGSLRLLCDGYNVEYAIIWYADEHDEGLLRPYFWLGDRDLSSLTCPTGQGSVGRSYLEEKAIRQLDYAQTQSADDRLFDDLEIRSMICIPFSTLREGLGCIAHRHHHRRHRAAPGALEAGPHHHAAARRHARIPERRHPHAGAQGHQPRHI